MKQTIQIAQQMLTDDDIQHSKLLAKLAFLMEGKLRLTRAQLKKSYMCLKAKDAKIHKQDEAINKLLTFKHMLHTLLSRTYKRTGHKIIRS